MAILTVINEPHATGNNGGRRLLKLSNGWIVAVTSDNANKQIRIFANKNDGQGFKQIGYLADPGLSTIIAADNYGNDIYVTFAIGASVYFVKVDATTTQELTNHWSSKVLLYTTTAFQSVSLVVDQSNGDAYVSITGKNSTYPNSNNLLCVKGTRGGGALTWGSIEQVTTVNTTGWDWKNPSIVTQNGVPSVLCEFTNGTSYYIVLLTKNFTGKELLGGNIKSDWGSRIAFDGGTYAQSAPSALIKKYGSNIGRIVVGFHGLDQTDTTKQNVRVVYSDDGMIWTAIGKITTGNTVDRKNVTLTENNNGDVYAVYEDNGSTVYQKCNNGTTSFSGLTTIDTGTNPSAIGSTAFTSVPVIYKTATSVKFSGAFNNTPSVTLTSPANNLVLSEGSGSNTLSVSGSATDVDSGNVVTVKYKINNGPTRALQSGVSNGSTPISFAKNLTYHDKRLWDGSTDVVGADLAENTPHTLHVWVEDDQGGISAEQTRNFTVIWNRPPTISGSDTNLGTILTIPTVNFSVTEPESDTFTITEYLDGVQTNSFAGVAGQNYSMTIDPFAWLCLELDVPHEMKVRATDSKGLYSERVFTFIRTETHLEFMLEYGDPDVEVFFTDDGRPQRILVTLDRYLPPGSALDFVKVTNNYLDTTPVWEDATGPVSAGRGYLFTNQTKTAAEWGINVWVQIDKGTATERVYVNGFGGAFD